jgi:hypothetical protein
VAVLSAQVDDLSKALEAARQTAGASSASLEGLTDRAEGGAKRLELLVASMHDIPSPAEEKPVISPDSETVFVRHATGEGGGRSQ